jgi:hypothetical protein
LSLGASTLLIDRLQGGEQPWREMGDDVPTPSS